MTWFVKLTAKSANAKTGPIPVSTTEEKSCPPSCPLKGGGCYGDGGPIRIVWRKVTEGVTSFGVVGWAVFCAMIAALAPRQIWRHNQVGDLPHHDGEISAPEVRALVAANTGRRGFTYTHHDPSRGHNARIIREANDGGFVVNLSADNLTEADALANLDIGPVVTLLPEGQTKNTRTPGGRKVVVCFAVTRDGVSCSNCAGGSPLCALTDRKFIVGFPAHGSTRHKASAIAEGS